MSQVSKKALAAYQAQREETRAPAKAIVRCLEEILQAAVEHDAASVEAGIQLLEDSLQLEINPVLSMDLLRIYSYIRHSAAKGAFDEAARFAEGLLVTWLSALELQEQHVPPDAWPIDDSGEQMEGERLNQ